MKTTSMRLCKKIRLNYSGGLIIRESVSSRCGRHDAYTVQKRNLPCSMVEREKLRDPDLKKLREALSEYLRILFKSIYFIHTGFRFLTPPPMNDITNLHKTMVYSKFGIIIYCFKMSLCLWPNNT